MIYAEKLKDPRWQKKRLEILDRDKFTCTNCGDSKSTLNVHHIKYARNPWDAPTYDLVTLCDHCHAMVEDLKVKASQAIMVPFGIGCVSYLFRLMSENDGQKVATVLGHLDNPLFFNAVHDLAVAFRESYRNGRRDEHEQTKPNTTNDTLCDSGLEQSV